MKQTKFLLLLRINALRFEVIVLAEGKESKLEDEAKAEVKAMVETVKRDEMLLDDFLNRAERSGSIEMLSAFAKFIKAKNIVKQTLGEWEKHFEEFAKAIP